MPNSHRYAISNCGNLIVVTLIELKHVFYFSFCVLFFKWLFLGHKYLLSCFDMAT